MTGFLILGGVACLAVGLVKLLSRQRDQGAIANGTAAGVFAVSALVITAVCVLSVISQGGGP